MAHIHRIAYTLTWDPPEVAGATHILENGTILYFQGAGVPIFHDIVEALNLTIEILYGSLADSLRMVGNGTAEMGALLLSHSADWTKDGLGSSFVFLHPLVKQASNVYFRQPSMQKFRIPLLAPFSMNVWIFLIGLLLTVTLLTSLAFRLSHIPINLKDFFKPTNLFHYIISTSEHFCGRTPLLAINEQIYNFKNDSSFKLVFKIGVVKLITTYCFTLILLIYTAKVVSTVMKTDNPIKTPDDLLKYNYVFSSYSHIHIDRLFMNQIIRKRILSHVHYGNGLDMISNVLEDNLTGVPQALLSHSDGFYPQALYSLGFGHELCSISSFSSSVKTARSYFIRKDSKLRESINLCILQLFERGLNHRHQRLHENKYKYSCPEPKLNTQHLTINHVSFALIVIAVGILQAIMNILHVMYVHFRNSNQVNSRANNTILYQNQPQIYITTV